VLCRDLSGYSLYQLLSHMPWPLPRPNQLPEHLDEAWYPPLRNALSLLQEEQQALFGGSLAQWLRAESE
jgi:membrane protein